jgi:hypothetical protein
VSGSRWLAEREPQPPKELSAAIADAMSQAEDRSAQRTNDRVDSDPPTDKLIVAAERLLPRVVLADCRERSGALDLLALDALLTYAMEAASKNAAECENTAKALLDAIGAASGAE